jgi:hypothetical protein
MLLDDDRKKDRAGTFAALDKEFSSRVSRQSFEGPLHIMGTLGTASILSWRHRDSLWQGVFCVDLAMLQMDEPFTQKTKVLFMVLSYNTVLSTRACLAFVTNDCEEGVWW